MNNKREKPLYDMALSKTNKEQFEITSTVIPTLYGRPYFEYSVNEYLVLSGECSIEEVNPTTSSDNSLINTNFTKQTTSHK